MYSSQSVRHMPSNNHARSAPQSRSSSKGKRRKKSNRDDHEINYDQLNSTSHSVYMGQNQMQFFPTAPMSAQSVQPNQFFPQMQPNSDQNDKSFSKQSQSQNELKCTKCLLQVFPHQPLYMLACFINIGAVICAAAAFLSWLQASIFCNGTDVSSQVTVFPHNVDIILYVCGVQMIAAIGFSMLIWKLAASPYHPRMCKAVTTLLLLYGGGIYMYVAYFARINDSMTTYATNLYTQQYGTCNQQLGSNREDIIEPNYNAETTIWRQCHSGSVYLQITAVLACLIRNMCCSASTKCC